MATTINAGRVAMVPKGEWSASTAYVRLDVVSYHGSSYVCKQDCTGQNPSTATGYWQLLSSGLDPTVDTISAKHYEGSTVTAETSISAAGVISKTASGVTKTYDLPADSGTLARKEETLPNKTYAPAEFSGLGRKYLQKNIVSNKNVLTQAMLQDGQGNALANTIFVIQYDYDLNEQSITIPAGCTLLFEGGSLNNGTIVGQNTAIEAPLSKIFGSTLEISGTWFIECLLPEWFGAKPNDAQVDNATYINKALEVGVEIHAAVMLQAGEYHTANTVELISNSTAQNEIFTPALVGKGRSVSRIVSTASLAVYVEGNHVRLNDIGIFRGGTISGINLTGIGIQFGDSTTQKAAKRSSIKDLVIRGFEKGMLFLYSWCNCTENIVIERCGNGVELTHTCTEEKLERFIIEDCYNCAIYSSYVWSIAITNSVIEGNCYGIKIDSASVVSINNCYFEQNSEYQVYIRGWINTMPETDAQGVVVNGGHILLGTSSNVNAIVNNANVTGCYFANHDTWATRPEDDPNNHKLVFDKVKALSLYSCANLISGYVIMTENCVVSRLDNTSFQSAYHADGVPRQDKAFGFPFAIDSKILRKRVIGSQNTVDIMPSVNLSCSSGALMVMYGNVVRCLRVMSTAADRFMKFSIKDESIVKALDYNFMVALDYGFGLKNSNTPDYLAQIDLSLIKDDDTEVNLFTQTREWSVKKCVSRFMCQVDLLSYKDHIKELTIKISISNESIAEWVSDVDDATNKTFFVMGLYFAQVGEIDNSFNANGGSELFSTSVLDVNRALHLPVTTPSVEKKAGTMVYDTTSAKAKYYNGTKWTDYDGATAGVLRSGTTANRPASADIYTGFEYFDTTLGGYVVWNGSAWVAQNKLATAGTTKLPVYVNSNGVPAAVDSVGEAYLSWGGKNLAGTTSPVDAALVDDLGANRWAFLPAAQTTVEYSNDGGTTWLDYELDNIGKVSLFCGLGTSIGLNKTTSFQSITTDMLVRVTVDAVAPSTGKSNIYSVLNKFAIYSIGSDYQKQRWVTIEGRTQANYANSTDTWSTIANKVELLGNGGWSIVNTSPITMVDTNVTVSANYRQVRFTFGQDVAETEGRLIIQKIQAYGGQGYTTPSNLAKTGHMYSWTAFQETVFPQGIRPAANNAYQNGGTSLRWSNVYSVLGNFSGKITASGGIEVPLGQTVTVGFLPVVRGGTGNTSSRPSLGSSDAGCIYWDTDLGKMIAWNGSAWVNLDGTALS